MSIVNRRNAVVGWAVLKVGKRAARKKAQDVPAKRAGGAAAGVLAALAGALFLRRKRRAASGDE